MAKTSKWFVVATEGATTDGRKIERLWLTQIAEDYDPKKYGARINLEHFKSRYFDKDDAHSYSYGDVLAVKTQETEDGKLQLLAQIEPTDKLVELVKQKQKVYTSIEVDTTFANTDRAYLVGLAVTDSPASLSTEYLSFCAGAKASPLSDRKQKAENLFTAAVETEFEFSEEKPSILAQVKALFAKKDNEAKAQKAEEGFLFADMQASILLLGESVANLETELEKAQAEKAKFAEKIAEYDAKFAKLAEEESKHYTPTPTITGSDEAASGRFF